MFFMFNTSLRTNKYFSIKTFKNLKKETPV